MLYLPPCSQIAVSRSDWGAVVKKCMNPAGHASFRFEVILVNPGALAHDKDEVEIHLKTARGRDHGEGFSPQVEIMLGLDPETSDGIAQFYAPASGVASGVASDDAEPRNRLNEVRSGVVAFWFDDFVSGFGGKVRFLASKLRRARIVLDIICLG